MKEVCSKNEGTCTIYKRKISKIYNIEFNEESVVFRIN